MVWNALIAVATVVAMTPADELPVVVLREEVTASGATVMLSDVAEIRGPLRLRHQLRSIDLSELSPGEEIRISRQLVSLRLQLAGFAPESVRLAGAELCLVRTEKPVALNLRAETLLQSHYANAFGVTPDRVRVRILNHLMPPSSDDFTKITTASLPDPKLGLGHAYLQMDSPRDNLKRTQMVKHQVELAAQIPVVQTFLRRGDIIRPDHIRWVDRFVSETPLSEDEVLGRTVSRDFHVGESLTDEDLHDQRTVRLVERGDYVRATAMIGRLTVKLEEAEAVSGGARGEVIQVTNLKTGKRFDAEVIGVREVRALTRQLVTQRDSADRRRAVSSQYGAADMRRRDSMERSATEYSGRQRPSPVSTYRDRDPGQPVGNDPRGSSRYEASPSQRGESEIRRPHVPSLLPTNSSRIQGPDHRGAYGERATRSQRETLGELESSERRDGELGSVKRVSYTEDPATRRRTVQQNPPPADRVGIGGLLDRLRGASR